MQDPFGLDETTPLPHDLAVERRTQFAQANASLALEGMAVDADDRTVQEAICHGLLTHDEAVALYLERAREAKA